MAELAIGSASVLVGLVVPFLTKYNIKDPDLIDEIKSMERWLDRMRASIESNTSSEDQVKQFRDIAYDIEDVLEKFFLHSPHVFRNHRVTQVHNLAHKLKFGFPLRNMRGEIQNIKRRLKEIKLQNETLQAGSSSSRPESSSSARNRHRVTPLLRENELVGYEDERKQFKKELIDGEKQLVNLAVGGPSGSGKTTFVNTIFWEHGIQCRFDCNAWVNVSRHFDLEKLLDNLLKQLCVSRKEPYPAADESLPTIHEKIRKYVGEKSYIVVLDDVWRAEDWNNIKDAFPNALYGSRIIVTTRDFNVASICASSKRSIYSLNGLDVSQSWRLFCSKAFQNTNRECPVDLKDSAKKIVKRCEGIPLAIVAVGCALAQKQKDQPVWKNFNLNLGRELEHDSFSIALQPSYMDLSSSLKSCLLYFSIFPEDVSVEYGRLIRLWVAERFATETDQQTAEEVASDYLDELIHRNLVLVSKWNLDDRPSSCRVLNLVHEFIIKKCKDENFTTIFSEHSTSASNKIRRLTFHGDCTGLPPHVDSTGVRSLLLFSCTDGSPNNIWNNLKRFQRSRVIDFHGAPLTEFPRHITDLTLLTYICFRDTKIETIPKSIKELRHLQTLDLKQTDVTELPKEISNLHNLRHLLAYKYTVADYARFDTAQAVKVYEGIGNLTELQKLSLVSIGERAEILQDLQKLKKLRRLGLMGIKAVHCTDLCRSIEGMRYLSSLDLTSDIVNDEYLELEGIRNPPGTLQRLYLKGPMKCIPGWITKLRNLLKIRLRWSKLAKSPIETLQCLPNLLEIELTDCYIGEELVFKGSSLKKLKVLHIQDLPKLLMIVIEQGSIPDLQKMSLHRCLNLLMPPLGIENLSNIKELVLYDMPQEFVGRIGMAGDFRWTVEHVPIIHSFTCTPQGWSLMNLSKSFYDRGLASRDPSNSR